MTIYFKTLFRPIFRVLPERLRELYYRKQEQAFNKQKFVEWERNGKPLPPPHFVKQMVVGSYRKKYGLTVLVETGTFLGDMVKAQLRNFKRIYSVELSEKLWGDAAQKFKKYKHVEIVLGDSGAVLKDLIPFVKTPAVFWLDGHYSEGFTARGTKDCPILEELSAIFTSNLNHVLLIDDARCFNGSGGYPTISELTDFILNHRPKSEIKVEDDIVRVRILN